MLLKSLNPQAFLPLHHVLAKSDTTTEKKIKSNLSTIPILQKAFAKDENQFWHRIHRPREVKQSWISTPASTVQCILDSFLTIFRVQPQLIICNGPGTALPLCYLAFFARLFGLWETEIIFVESFCRVERLSLTGRLIYPIADKFLVQWKELLPNCGNRAEYLGDMRRL